MKNYKAILKTVRCTENTRIDPDGFSTFSIFNVGTAPVLLNGVLPLRSGGRFDVPFEPYVKYASDLSVVFDGTGTKDAYVNLIYYTEL